MSLTTPILYSIPAFDASQPQVFTFYSVGGNQVTGNILTIKNKIHINLSIRFLPEH